MAQTNIFALSPLTAALARNWWSLLIRGIAAILFGLGTFIWPEATLMFLAAIYGAFALIDGVLALWAAVFSGAASRWWLFVVGILGIVVGLTTMLYPGLSAITLMYFIAVWAVASGLLQLIGAFQLRKEIDDEWMLIGGGILLIIFGLLLFVEPTAGTLGVLLIIGGCAVAYGLFLLGLAFRLRKYAAERDSRHSIQHSLHVR